MSKKKTAKRSKGAKIVPISSRASLTDTHEELEELDDNTVVAPSHERAKFQTLPAKAGDAWVDIEYRHLAKEQTANHWADGEQRIAPHRIARHEAKVAADNEQFLLDTHKPHVSKTAENHLTLAELLLGTERARRHRFLHHAAMVVLPIGDLVGVTAGADLLGENPVLALLQGVAAGSAAVVSGFMGAEIKRCVLARSRKSMMEDLAEEDPRLARMIGDVGAAEPLIKVVAFGALGIDVLLTGSVFALRAATEGLIQGFVFAALAGAVALASWINSYYYADPLADALEAAHETARRSEKHLQKLANAPARAVVAANEAAMFAIAGETQHRGNAAYRHILAHLNGLKNRYSGTFGHGKPSKGLRKVRAAKWANKLQRQRYGEISVMRRTDISPSTNGDGPPSTNGDGASTGTGYL